MELWKDGDLASLMKEALTIQHRLKKSSHQKKTSINPARQFADLVFQGKIKQALEMLSKDGSGGVLRLDDTVNRLMAKFTRTRAHVNAGLNSCKFQSEVCFKFAAVSKKL